MNISELVKLAQNGDATAQAQLYEETNKKAYYLALRLIQNPDDAMDVLQDSYIAAFRSLDNLQNPESFPAWLAQIVSNRCKNLLRTRNRFADIHFEDEERDYFSNIEDTDEAILPHEVLDKAEIRNLILQMIDELPDEQRECIMLYYFSGLTIEQIAETQGCSTGTVKSRLNYARRKLKENVLELEKRTDIRLHTLVPIGLLFTGFAADLPGQQAFAATWNGISSELAASNMINSVSGTVTNAAKTGVATVIKGKTTALILAAVVTVGGGAGAVVLNHSLSDNTGLSSVEKNEVVTFHSTDFEIAFAEATGLTVGEITMGDLEEVWGIEIDNGILYVDTVDGYTNSITKLDVLNAADLTLFPELESLTLRQISAKNTIHLTDLNLKSLWLDEAIIEDWSHINGIEELLYLNINCSSAAVGAVDFCLLPALEVISLTTNYATEWNTTFQNLSTLKNLISFTGQCFDGTPDMSFFAGLSAMEYCYFHVGGEITLHAFANNANLRNLDLDGLRASGEEPSILSGIECVRIFYSNEPFEQGGQISYTDYAEYEIINGVEVDSEEYSQRNNALWDEIHNKLEYY